MAFSPTVRVIRGCGGRAIQRMKPKASSLMTRQTDFSTRLLTFAMILVAWPTPALEYPNNLFLGKPRDAERDAEFNYFVGTA